MTRYLGGEPYAEPPWRYRDVRITTVWCRTARPSTLVDHLPPTSRPVRRDGLFALLHLDVGAVLELGPEYSSNELALLIPARTEDGATGGLIAAMLVDNDAALTAGREIWGHPKVLGRVMSRWEHDGQRGLISADRVRHLDGDATPAVEITVDLDRETPEDLDAMNEMLHPRLLVAPDRDPATGRPRSSRTTALELEDVVVSLQRSAVAEVRLGPWLGLDELGEVEVLGATHQLAQFTLGYAIGARK
jgi:acetoacetate decarboxylase